MVTYIKNNIPGIFVDFQNSLDTSMYNNIGVSWSDFLSGKWVRLNEKQKLFHKNNPNSTPEEVFFMKNKVYEENILTIEDYKDKKEREIWEYDRSKNINLVFLNKKEVWFSKEERQSLKMRLDAENSLNKERTNIWFENERFNMKVSDAFSFLSHLENYAAECFDNTKKHIASMRKLNDIDAIALYEYKVGYPEKLNLEYA